MAIEGYRSFTHRDGAGRGHAVYRRGSGPPVIIIHELAGISPMLLDFAARVVDAGFSVYLPELIPRPTGPFRLLVATVRVCISGEFVKLARGKTSPIVTWLRSLAKRIHSESHHPVGAIGMCLTGGFALAMAVDDYVAGPVMAHPSLPLAIGSRRRWDLGLDPEHLRALHDRKNLRILGVRFSNDLVAPSPRFDRMDAEFGTQFKRSELPSGCRNPLGLPPWEHSVLNNPRLRSGEEKHARARVELERVTSEVVDFLKAELVDG